MTCGVSLSAIRLADVCCPVEFGADHFYPAFSEQTEINNTHHALRLQLRGRTHQRPCRKTHFSATICHSDSQVFQQRWRMWTTHTHTPGAGQLPSGWTHSCPVDMQDSRELSCWVCGTPAALGSSGETTGTNWTSTAAFWFSPERRREVQLLPEALAPVHNMVSCSCCSYPESWVWSSRCRPQVCACVSVRWDRASIWLGSGSGDVVELLCRQSGIFQEYFPDRVYHSKSDRALAVSLKARLCFPIMQWGGWQLAVRLGLGMSGQSL